ncbi:MAG: hypothetical protein HW386_958 [Gammaproteobacteria bacterium]|nr:hypothetical protein [Gammaproteobacteria bacterium]
MRKHQSRATHTGTTVVQRSLAGILITFMVITHVYARTGPAHNGSGRTDFTGVWAPVFSEDWGPRLPGPERGDYVGLPVNDAARKVADAWDADIQYRLEGQCIPHTAVYIMRSPFQFEILQSDNILTMVSESFEQVRTVYLDGRDHHPEEAPLTYMGNSVGSWDGDTLVIRTVNMEEGYIRRNGLPHSSKAVLTERLIRHTGTYGDYLTLIQIVEDPVYLTEPLVRSISFKHVPDGRLEPYPCIKFDFDK